MKYFPKPNNFLFFYEVKFRLMYQKKEKFRLKKNSPQSIQLFKKYKLVSIIMPPRYYMIVIGVQLRLKNTKEEETRAIVRN